VRWLLRRLTDLYARRHPDHAHQWQPFSGEFLNRPGVLPVLSTGAPRWNPHAIIGSTGPFVIKQAIGFHSAVARKSAALWTLVIYSYPHRETVGILSSFKASGKEWDTLDVKPGTYVVGLRYYRWKEQVEFPAIQGDSQDLVPAKKVPRDINDFYNGLFERRSPFYYGLHFYVYTMLRFRNMLPSTFVERQYAPVGNPETRYLYDTIQAGDHLQFKAPPAVLRDYDIYLTIYSRHSLPALWRQISDSQECVSPVKGFYLVRIHPRFREASDWKNEIQQQFACYIQNPKRQDAEGGALT